MIEFSCFVLEDIMERGMFMAPETPGVQGCLTFKTAHEAEAYLWSKDCLVVMGYHVLLYGINELQDKEGGL
jgi:hypothetical protein